MGQYTYIKKSIRKHFVTFAEPLSVEEYNNIGETFDDYQDNKWVLLSAEQVAFYASHPNATVKEVWDMQITPQPVHTRTLEEAKIEKINEINNYDQSDNVNSFSINDQTMWLSVEERQQIATQINANSAVGRTSMTKWFNGQEFTFTLTQWQQMLVALEVYAGDALNVTEAHRATVNALDTIEAVDNYDYSSGYPEKLVFGNN